MPKTPLLLRPLLFVNGKGGVGKSTVAEVLCQTLIQSGKKTLLVQFPNRLQKLEVEASSGWSVLRLELETAFEQYMEFKLKIPRVARFFSKNPLIQYLIQAAPGLKDLVFLGKIWHERLHFDHVIVDMPSTGHGIAVFQSMSNFSTLFQSGPLSVDAKQMHKTLNDSTQTGLLLVSLPEEMPLQETLELGERIKKIFPKNDPWYLCNKIFPSLPKTSSQKDSLDLESSQKNSATYYVQARTQLEIENLKLWNNVSYTSLPWISSKTREELTQKLSEQLKKIYEP